MQHSLMVFTGGRHRVALPLLLITLSACHNVKLTPEAQAVRVLRDRTQVSRCRFISDVESSDRLSGGMINREKAEDNAYKILKQKSAQLGANTVLVSTSTSGYQGAGMKGKAYACSSS